MLNLTIKVRPRPYCREWHTSSLVRTKNHAFAWFLKVRPRPYCRERHTSSLVRTKNHAFAWFLKVRPTGIELVSSAPQADTLSIELWALKSDF